VIASRHPKSGFGKPYADRLADAAGRAGDHCHGGGFRLSDIRIHARIVYRQAKLIPCRPRPETGSLCVQFAHQAVTQMQFEPTRLPEVVLIRPRVFNDQRGSFFETWHQRAFADAGITASFVQDNMIRDFPEGQRPQAGERSKT